MFILKSLNPIFYHFIISNFIISFSISTIEFSYPLENGVINDYYCIGGFSRLFLAQCIYEGYYTIYSEKDLEKYGVWGHSMGNLSLMRVEYIKAKKYCMLRIDS